MTTNEFSHPQRMSPAAFLIIFTKLFKQCAAPLSIAGVYNIITAPSDDKWKVILVAAAGILSVPLIWALLSYLTKKFYIKDGSLIFTHGIISREKNIVPLDRVHSLRTEKGILFRLLDMRGIIFDTLAKRDEEIELILDEYEWKRLLAVIEKEERPHPESDTEPPEFNPTNTVHYPTKNLLLAALCQNHLKGMAVIISFLAVVFGSFDDLSEEQAKSVLGWLDSTLDSTFASPLLIIETLFVGYILILLLWLGRILLRYFDTSMSYDKNLLTFTYGLLTRQSCRFFRDKICTIWIKRNFLEKKFGFSTLKLKQALNVTAQKEDSNMTLYGTDSSSFYLKWWLGEDYASEKNLADANSGKGVFYRHVAFRALIAIGIAIVLLCDHLFIWTLIPLVYLTIIIPRGICAMRHSRIELKQTYFIVHKGSFAEIDNYVKYSNVEIVSIHRSPLTRWSHRVALVIATSGTLLFVRSLKEEEALLIRELLLLKSKPINF
ncbi:MAG: PH domain-containing protein [Muribaculaceae bacterium]|nr:PH domain-containing protein [Muribaculaceae bacterium]